MKQHEKIFDEILKQEATAEKNTNKALGTVNDLLAKSDNKELNELCRSVIASAQKGVKPNVEDFIKKAKQYAS